MFVGAHDGTRALNNPFRRFRARAQRCRDEEVGPTSVGGRANELFLFYGTGATPPLKVKMYVAKCVRTQV